MAKKWEKPLRIIQTNLQVTDALDLDAERLAEQILELGANALVFNVGGIYAWYPTEIPYHTVNPLMAPGRDIVGEVVEACRKRDIVFIARYDFSKAADSVYREHPEWFVRRDGNRPQIVAVDRLGQWDQLVSTCLHGGYQNEEVAYKVLKESMEKYHPDAIFITSMIYPPCQCENCRRIYQELYGAELPEDPAQYASGFAERMMDDSVKRYDAVVKSIDPDAAFLHRAMVSNEEIDQAETFRQTKWWFPRTGEYDVFFEHPIDMIHGETHNSLTGGRKRLEERYTSGLSIKIANSLPHAIPPVDIVHTAPGLGWRHTGLPTAEHRFWASQVPANGGQIWHALTGIPDHIIDKGQLETVRWVDERIQAITPLMHTAESAADVALLLNGRGVHQWAYSLTSACIPYDVLLQRQIAAEGIPSRFLWIICPESDGYFESTITALERFVNNGGGLILEGRVNDKRLRRLAGLTGPQQRSELLSTSYLRVDDESFRSEAGTAPLVPFTGFALYSRYDSETKTLASLIPPFAPPEGAGSPPERAVLPTVRTAWPMISRRGNVIHCAFSFCDLAEKYGLRSHLQLLDAMLSGERRARISETAGLQLTVFRVEGGYMIHLINGVGERPLQTTTKVYGSVLSFTLSEGESLERAQWLFGDEELSAQVDGRRVTVPLPPLDTWEAVLIRTREVAEND